MGKSEPSDTCFLNKSYVFLSGLGGFGLEFVNLLILRNAQNISLTLQNVIEYGYQHMRIELWQSSGVSFKNLICLYASKRDGCKLILKTALSK
ncbi:hypothetical protein HZH68_004024 [Vespula germanica]|uniref:Uncharacterized protein n=1 Tax=Vespula germanica TaxID=30212 RepID=A0A834KMZ2_VESGE|nr:hypothetical protein HZH68_004024 [Vespula germanica]